MPQVRKEAGLFRLAPMPLYFITCWTMFCGDCAQVTALLLIIIKLFRRRWAATNISRPRSRWLLPSRDKKPQWTAHANVFLEFTEFFDSLTSWAKDAVFVNLLFSTGAFTALAAMSRDQRFNECWISGNVHAAHQKLVFDLWIQNKSFKPVLKRGLLQVVVTFGAHPNPSVHTKLSYILSYINGEPVGAESPV